MSIVNSLNISSSVNVTHISLVIKKNNHLANLKLKHFVLNVIMCLYLFPFSLNLFSLLLSVPPQSGLAKEERRGGLEEQDQ